MLITENSIKFAVLKIKSCVSTNETIFFDFISHKKIALVISVLKKSYCTLTSSKANRSIGLKVTTPISVQKAWGLSSKPVKSDAVLQTARHRTMFWNSSCVAKPRRWDYHSFHEIWCNIATRECNEDLIFLLSFIASFQF